MQSDTQITKTKPGALLHSGGYRACMPTRDGVALAGAYLAIIDQEETYVG
jgi:hypothetical protein